MRQFDVIVLEAPSSSNKWIPPFEDPALGWFHSLDWNQPLQSIDAEWVVFANPAVKIDRDFLNSLAECIEGFPMVDAFAPRVKFESHFYGGLLLNGAKGFAPISENEKMRFVAAPSPMIAVFSSRIIQRTGLFDLDLPPEFRLLDYTLRMAHAGGKMFSVPYLVASLNEGNYAGLLTRRFLHEKQAIAPLWEIYYKSLPIGLLSAFTFRHLTMLPKFLGLDKGKKRRQFKRDKATSLSKLTAKYLKEISL
ncbi:Glycosyltransferase, GT2 family [Fibrobacter sp. UWB15]|uniref:hypothetical protein n=1 Tax=unclassified Fibrobacter TaxID=2634177 RepID=UPI000920DE7C|nr:MULTISPECIES: hypothetical protein [unclassified Fibrobacter]PWJ67832.1 GT2 family glycosyltransferase [Fibrobacter sp. UWB6]SHF79488.1 Glycosyltransferase, GT2 family [Fibrobacter sp. UWB8]SMG15579.1 Glycosyltransferase, GT2 family [Fibrobacter sp. UWB15]